MRSHDWWTRLGELPTCFQHAVRIPQDANLHRVISPLISMDRLSLPFFSGLALDATIPLRTLSDELAAPGITADPAAGCG